jgi:hypothetical protein
MITEVQPMKRDLRGMRETFNDWQLAKCMSVNPYRPQELPETLFSSFSPETQRHYTEG